eukprot:RCo016382
MALKAMSDKFGSLFSVSAFQGNVDEATSEFLLSPDWDKNLALVDIVNEKEENAKEVLRAVRKRTSNANPKVQYLALVVLETCVKNCGRHLRGELCQQKDLLADVLKIATKEAHVSGERETQEKALHMINSWHNSFRSKPHYMPLSALYQQALGRGANFSGLKDEDTLLTDEAALPRPGGGSAAVPPGGYSAAAPQRRAQPQPGYATVPMGDSRARQPATGTHGSAAPAQAQAQGQAQAQAQAQARAPTAQDMAQMVHHLIEEAQGCVGLFSELLTANASTPGVLVTDELCQQILMQCRQTQAAVMRTIESGVSENAEGSFEVLLGLNDALLGSLGRYEELTAEAHAVLRAAAGGGP